LTRFVKDFWGKNLVLLCHKNATAWASWELACEGVSDLNADGCDGVGDVTLGAQRQRRGVDSLLVRQAARGRPR